jgi:hypothetical protein
MLHAGLERFKNIITINLGKKKQTAQVFRHFRNVNYVVDFTVREVLLKDLRTMKVKH